jgi:peptidoglycan/LPS O-acetylase OafA/YrhL
VTTAGRLPSLDVAKGVAILFVVGIHSELLSPSVVFLHAINRAVPMFLVLFGLTSVLWWDKHGETGSLADWYRSRLTRLLPSYWLAVAVWWGGQRVLSARYVGVDALLWSLAGYAPWIQASWFVTVILQIVVVFPLLRLAFRGLGTSATVLAGLAALVAVQVYFLPLNAWLRALLPYHDRTFGFYALWLFVPAYLWLLFCGMALGHKRTEVTTAQAAVALAVVVAAGLVAASVADSSAISRIAMAVADPARVIVLLAAAAAVVPIKIAYAPLAWLGHNSWEIYVGHMAVHSLGYSAWSRMGGPADHRAAYALMLLAGGVVFAICYSELLRRLSASAARA